MDIQKRAAEIAEGYLELFGRYNLTVEEYLAVRRQAVDELERESKKKLAVRTAAAGGGRTAGTAPVPTAAKTAEMQAPRRTPPAAKQEVPEHKASEGSDASGLKSTAGEKKKSRFDILKSLPDPYN